METEEIIKICKERNELNFLFQITKCVAESDSIGEGYSYCYPYTEERFNNAEKSTLNEEDIKRGRVPEYCPYLESAGVSIYELYLSHIGIIKKMKKMK